MSFFILAHGLGMGAGGTPVAATNKTWPYYYRQKAK
jgi:hypothetical protein